MDVFTVKTVFLCHSYLFRFEFLVFCKAQTDLIVTNTLYIKFDSIE